MNLRAYDWIVVNHSGGKDGQAALDLVVALAKAQRCLQRVVLVHADLGRDADWPGTLRLVRQHARHYRVRLEVVRARRTFSERVSDRGMWPGPGKGRYCTSDLKRGPVRTLFTRLVREWDQKHRHPTRSSTYPGQRVRILNVMGMRAEESDDRALLPVLEVDADASNGYREVTNWLPVHSYTVGQVWARIKASGVPHHYAYDLGLPRVSCMFCFFAPKAALVLSAFHNPKPAARLVRLETRMGHTLKKNLSLREVVAEAETLRRQGLTPPPAQNWSM